MEEVVYYKMTCALRYGAEATVLWSPDAKSQLIIKDLDPGKVWKLKEKGTTEDNIV